MGKITGFMEFDRITNRSVEPKDRIKNYLEFHPPLKEEDRKNQAARCMNCGVPFCQSGDNFGGMVSGCPLHNLIPEWNDEIYNGHWKEALDRLLKTSNFPEFTGRVCPALCEAACTCGLNGSSVTVHDNELAIIETGFANGWMQPRIPKSRSDKRIAVIGSGPSGLAVADQLNRRGHTVVVYEREDRPGGLLMYGIPNMKLEKQIIDRRIKLMEAEGVTFELNSNIGSDVTAQSLLDDFDAVVLCCGSKKPRDLDVPGRDAVGVHFAVDFLTESTKALLEDRAAKLSATGKNVIVVGGGDTGNDCVGTVIRQGCKSVTQLEMMAKLPDERAESNPWPQWPRVCKTDYGQEEAIEVFGHDPRIYTTTVKEIISDDDGNVSAVKTVKLAAKADKKTGRVTMQEIPDSEETLPCELLLIAAGFVGCENYVADAFGVVKTGRGTIETQPEQYQTNVEKVFVAGDAHRGQSLVVWAISEGRQCARAVDEYLIGYSADI